MSEQPPETILIEKTGKPIKAKLAIARVVICIGMFMAFFGDSNPTKVWGCIIAICGCILFKYAQSMKWWHHD